MPDSEWVHRRLKLFEAKDFDRTYEGLQVKSEPLKEETSGFSKNMARVHSHLLFLLRLAFQCDLRADPALEREQKHREEQLNAELQKASTEEKKILLGRKVRHEEEQQYPNHIDFGAPTLAPRGLPVSQSHSGHREPFGH